MNPFVGQHSNKRDFDMAMGGYDSNTAQYMQGQNGVPQLQPGPMNPGFMPMYGQMAMSFNQQHMPNAPQPQMMGFDHMQMQFMGAAPRFYSSTVVPATVDAAKEAPKSNADWALEKRRARNRITAAESRRKCKEEIQSLREELVRLKEEKAEKEELIRYYKNRYEKYEVAADLVPVSSEVKTEVKAEREEKTAVAESNPLTTEASHSTDGQKLPTPTKGPVDVSVESDVSDVSDEES